MSSKGERSGSENNLPEQFKFPQNALKVAIQTFLEVTTCDHVAIFLFSLKLAIQIISFLEITTFDHAVFHSIV